MGARHPKPSGKVERIDAPDGRSSLFRLSANPEGSTVEDAHAAATEMHMEMSREVLRRKGLDKVPGAEEVVRRRAKQFITDLDRETRARGIAPQIVRLFGAPSKRDVEKIASGMVITAQEFTALVSNAHSQLGYRHRMRWAEFVPEHLRTASDRVSEWFKDAKPGPASPKAVKAMNAIKMIFEERKRVHAHLFERGAKWHCFFFDFNDMTDPDHGPHLHFISHRWADVDRETVWASFEKRRQSIPRGVHIRYVEPRCEEDARRRKAEKRKPKRVTSGFILGVDPAPESDPPEE